VAEEEWEWDEDGTGGVGFRIALAASLSKSELSSRFRFFCLLVPPPLLPFPPPPPATTTTSEPVTDGVYSLSFSNPLSTTFRSPCAYFPLSCARVLAAFSSATTASMSSMDGNASGGLRHTSGERNVEAARNGVNFDTISSDAIHRVVYDVVIVAHASLSPRRCRVHLVCS
jgi:hypothetical protein